jgi:hypothetical protein
VSATKECFFRMDYGKGCETASIRSMHVKSPGDLCAAIVEHLICRKRGRGGALQKNSYAVEKMSIVKHSVMKCCQVVCMHIILCEGNGVMSWFMDYGYGNLRDLISLISIVRQGDVMRAREALHMRHNVGVSGLTMRNVHLGGDTFPPQVYSGVSTE